MKTEITDAILALAREMRAAAATRTRHTQEALDAYDAALGSRSEEAVDFLKKVKDSDDNYAEESDAALARYAVRFRAAV